MRYVLGEGGKIGKDITSRNQNIQQLKNILSRCWLCFCCAFYGDRNFQK